MQIAGADGKEQPRRDLIFFKCVAPRFLNVSKEDFFVGEQELRRREEWIVPQIQELALPGGIDRTGLGCQRRYHLDLPAQGIQKGDKPVFLQEGFHDITL